MNATLITAALACMLLAGPAAADQPQPADAAPPAAAGSAESCSDVAMRADGTIVPPAGVDSDAVDAARAVIMLFPIDTFMKKLDAPIDAAIEKGLESSANSEQRDAYLHVKADKADIVATMRRAFVDALASGIACRQTKGDLEAFAAFLRTSGGQKITAAATAQAANHDNAIPDLTDAEAAQVRDFAASDAGKHVFGEIRRGSKTDAWMQSEFAVIATLLINWVKSKYHLPHFGDPA